MRIVGGELKGRAIHAPRGGDVRPTSDRAREAVFNILLNGKPGVDFEGITVLDVFAGTGALGLEALSRGAVRSVFIDSSVASLAALKENVKALKMEARCLTLKIDSAHIARRPFAVEEPASLVFLDPPYGQELEGPALAALAKHGWLAPDAVIVVETTAKEPFEAPQGFSLIDSRKYGAALVTFLRLD